ncbi:MAG: TIM barrel protein [Phycisphaerales bacterium]|nr:TIM barrel protein [Phycisphaerales bacterium]
MSGMDRRTALGAMAVGAGAITGGARAALGAQPKATEIHAHRGPLKQSICRWCYGGMDMKTLCENAVDLGYKSIEILTEPDWAIVREHGLDCAVAMGPVSIGGGINLPESHDKFVSDCEALFPKARDAGIPNVIIFSGNRHDGLTEEQGRANCAQALERVVPIAEKTGVRIIMELLNSKVDHGGYMCDKTPWGVELVKSVNSDSFKLLYDIYHMQIMEGDVIRTIRDNHQHIAHYHTGGVPGRREIDETQELYYPAIIKAILETGYTGFLGQEFIPSRDPVASLKQAHAICNV